MRLHQGLRRGRPIPATVSRIGVLKVNGGGRVLYTTSIKILWYVEIAATGDHIVQQEAFKLRSVAFFLVTPHSNPKL